MQENYYDNVADTLPEAYKRGLRQRIDDKQLDLPMLPDVAAQIIGEGFHQDTDVLKLSGMIHRDPALAGHVLRVANSPIYCPGAPIVSLQQALVRLGMTQIREIVVSVAIKSKVFKSEEFHDDLVILWKHSAAAAAYAREIAKIIRTNVENAFLCGLLHDVGKPIVLMALSELKKNIPEPLDRTQAMEAASKYHQEVGELIADHWRLPGDLKKAISLHHQCEKAPKTQETTMITCLANGFSRYILTQDKDFLEELKKHPLLEILSLYPDDIENLIEQEEMVVKFMEAMI